MIGIETLGSTKQTFRMLRTNPAIDFRMQSFEVDFAFRMHGFCF